MQPANLIWNLHLVYIWLGFWCYLIFFSCLALNEDLYLISCLILKTTNVFFWPCLKLTPAFLYSGKITKNIWTAKPILIVEAAKDAEQWKMSRLWEYPCEEKTQKLLCKSYSCISSSCIFTQYDTKTVSTSHWHTSGFHWQLWWFIILICLMLVQKYCTDREMD